LTVVRLPGVLVPLTAMVFLVVLAWAS